MLRPDGMTRWRCVNGESSSSWSSCRSFVVRGYHSAHKEFGFQMFPESSTWQADIVRVTDDGRRIPISDPWDGYHWSQMVRSRGLASPGVRHHADAGLENQLAFLDAALHYVADHTPRERAI